MADDSRVVTVVAVIHRAGAYRGQLD
ncbi:MAG: hypothetical protein WCG47_05445 [Dermatophilaceae bacterium]